MLPLRLGASLEGERARADRGEVGPPRDVASAPAIQLAAGRVHVRVVVDPERQVLIEDDAGREREPPAGVDEDGAVAAVLDLVQLFDGALLIETRPARDDGELRAV